MTELQTTVARNERPRIGLISVYFTLFDEQMPADFRNRLTGAADVYRDALAREFEVVYPGLLTSDEDGRRANAFFKREKVDAIVFAPTMAAPPSYAANALEGLEIPLLIWNAPLVDRLGLDLDQAGAHEHTSVLSAVMLGNTMFRRGVRTVVVTCSPDDAAGVAKLLERVRGMTTQNYLSGGVMLRIGDPIDGYLDVETTAAQLTAIGLREQEIGQSEFVAAVQSVSDEEVETLRAELRANQWMGEADVVSVRVAAAILSLIARYGALGGTVNCHGPLLRFGQDVGVCACLGVSLATARGTPFSCTGDQPTAIALALGRKVAGAALYSEIFAPELSTGLALVSNGGEGDPAWASGPITIAPSLHYPGVNGRGASLYFPLEPAPCTLLSVSPGVGGWRGAWAHAEIVESRYPRMMAPNAMIRFRHEPESGVAVDRWTMAGAVHHQALLRGHLSDELTDVLATCGIDPIQGT